MKVYVIQWMPDEDRDETPSLFVRTASSVEQAKKIVETEYYAYSAKLADDGEDVDTGELQWVEVTDETDLHAGDRWRVDLPNEMQTAIITETELDAEVQT